MLHKKDIRVVFSKIIKTTVAKSLGTWRRRTSSWATSSGVRRYVFFSLLTLKTIGKKKKKEGGNDGERCISVTKVCPKSLCGSSRFVGR